MYGEQYILPPILEAALQTGEWLWRPDQQPLESLHMMFAVGRKLFRLNRPLAIHSTSKECVRIWGRILIIIIISSVCGVDIQWRGRGEGLCTLSIWSGQSDKGVCRLPLHLFTYPHRMMMGWTVIIVSTIQDQYSCRSVPLTGSTCANRDLMMCTGVTRSLGIIPSKVNRWPPAHSIMQTMQLCRIGMHFCTFQIRSGIGGNYWVRDFFQQIFIRAGLLLLLPLWYFESAA